MSNEIEKQLVELGLDGNKAKIYLACLELGRGTVIEIAKQAGIKRTTVYDNIDYLENKSLVTQEFEGNKKFYVARPPKALHELVNEKEEIVKDLVPQLYPLFNALPAKPKIQYFHGHQGIRDVSRGVLTSSSKKVYYLGNMYDYFKILKEEKTYSQGFVKEKVERGVWSYAIWKYDPRILNFYTPEKNKKELREVRFAPKEMELDVFIQLYDDKVGIISTKGEGYAMIMESRDLNRTLKSVFDILWSVSKLYTKAAG